MPNGLPFVFRENDRKRVLGTKVEPIFAERRPGDIRSSLADISVAQQVLGYAPVVTFEEGLRRSIEYYKSLSE